MDTSRIDKSVVTDYIISPSWELMYYNRPHCSNIFLNEKLKTRLILSYCNSFKGDSPYNVFSYFVFLVPGSFIISTNWTTKHHHID